jgi:hypothetical protein
VFTLVIKYLGFLKGVPLAGLVFDSCLKLWTFTTNRPLLDWMDNIEANVLTWPGTTSTLHKYGGMQFNANGVEIGHIHSNGLLDMLLNRQVKQQLLTEGHITDHHTFVNSGWISFYIRTEDDATYALSLLRLGYDHIAGLNNKRAKKHYL